MEDMLKLHKNNTVAGYASTGGIDKRLKFEYKIKNENGSNVYCM